MSVILLPLHMPATHWVPQRITYAPIPKNITPASGDEPPHPEIDYWEFTDDANQALRVQFRVPSGYDSTVDPIFKFHWFTPKTVVTNVPLVKIGQVGCQQSDDVDLTTLGVGTLTTVTGMTPHATVASVVRDQSVTLDGTAWAAGDFANIVFYRNGAHASDILAEVLNFLGGDLLIGVTKSMG